MRTIIVYLKNLSIKDVSIIKINKQALIVFYYIAEYNYCKTIPSLTIFRNAI